MFLQIEDFKSSHPDFQAPKSHNGEALPLFSLELNGAFLIARYFNEVPIAGPQVERYLVDVYLNDAGREVFRLTSKFIEPPPPPMTARQRIADAWRALWGVE